MVIDLELSILSGYVGIFDYVIRFYYRNAVYIVFDLVDDLLEVVFIIWVEVYVVVDEFVGVCLVYYDKVVVVKELVVVFLRVVVL